MRDRDRETSSMISKMLRGAIVATTLAVALVAGMPTLDGQSPQDDGPRISTLSEPNEGLVIRGESRRSRRVRFAAARRGGQGLVLPQAGALSATERALRFVDTYGDEFGVGNRGDLEQVRAASRDALNVDHVRFRQRHKGVPVRGSELTVHLRGGRVVAANARIAEDLPDNVGATISAGEAQQHALELVQARMGDRASDAQFTTVALEIFDRGLFDQGEGPARLAWFVELRGMALRQWTWIDAENGNLLFDVDQITDARVRQVYNVNHGSSLPGTLARSEGGGANGDEDVDEAYTFSGDTYDYFSSVHGRDSYNNAGATLLSSVHYGTNYANAFWNGTQMVYGDNYTADDVVGHELTHAVTERSANLIYSGQSGALNESFSDIFGETVDQLNGAGNDATNVRWLEGEDLPGGHIRNMMTPTLRGHPGKMSDPELSCTSYDNYGVHLNSGIPNHAYALMVDGGTYNGRTITGIGLTKAGKIEYRALTNYLTASATFLDDYNALNQSCTDLIGTAGITSADCTQVNRALEAVEMNLPWGCSPPPPPPMCPSGSPTSVFTEGFETANSNFTATSTTSTQWSRYGYYAKTGAYSAYGPDYWGVSDLRFAMTSNIQVPSQGRFYFHHYFRFDSSGGINFDGGVVEYSLDNGSTWQDAGGFIDAGRNYNGVLTSGSALAGRAAFTGNGIGFTASRFDLASLSGQLVKFRFRVASDSIGSSDGWYVDDVSVYGCGTAPSNGTLTVDRTNGTAGTPVTVTITNGPGGIGDWITLAQVSAPNTTYGAWTYVGTGVKNRTWTTSLPASGGPFEFRLFQDNGYTRLATSPVITLGADNPVPVVTGLNPVGVFSGGSAFTLTVQGTGFVNGSEVRVDGSARVTTFVSPTTLTASLLSGDISAVGSRAITVVSPSPGGGSSSSKALSVVAAIPAPVITSTSPATLVVGATSQVLYVYGNNFTHSSQIYMDGSPRTTSFSSATTLYTSLYNEILGEGAHPITVVTPAPGGGTSNTKNLSVVSLTPPACTTGNPNYAFFENFEAANDNFTATSSTATQWTRSTALPKNGAYSAFALNPAFTSDHRYEMTSAVVVPASGKLYFHHHFRFESYWDGGVIEYTTNGGSTWIDAESLIEAGRGYDQVLSPGNPMGARRAYTGYSHPTGVISVYVGTRLNLSSLAGQSVRFRFRVGTDSIIGATGWYVDDVGIYNCGAPPALTTDLSNANSGTPITVTLANGLGGAQDWLAIAPVGSADTTYGAWTYVGTGVTSRTWTTALPSGAAAYEFRLLANNGFQRLATSAPITVNTANPVPALTSLSPASVVAGRSAFALSVTGSGFVNGSVVQVDGVNRSTSFVSSTQLTASILVGDVASVGTRTITVVSPTPGGGTSSGVTLTMTAAPAAPTLTSINPTSKPRGSSATVVTVTGTHFVSASEVRVNGVSRPTTYVSPTSLTATLPSGDFTTAGSLSVTVYTPAPGGGTSGAVSLTVTGPLLTLNTTSAVPGGTNVTVTLSNGLGGATDWIALAPAAGSDTSYATWVYVGNGVTARTWNPAMPATPGTYEFRLFANDGYTRLATSAAITVAAGNPAPTLTSVVPNHIVAGTGPATVTVNGTGFVAASSVLLNASSRSITLVSPTQLTFVITEVDAQSPVLYGVRVSSPAPGGGTSGPASLYIDAAPPAPTVTSVSPSSVPAGVGATPVTVTGAYFVNTSTVLVDGVARPTTYVSSTSLTALLPGTDFTSAGTRAISVFTPSPGGGTSGTVNLTVSAAPDVPSITSITPTSRPVNGGQITLTVIGANFVNGSTVHVDGSSRSTAFGSLNQLTATLPASDFLSAGSRAITVVTPAPGGGTSNAATLSVGPTLLTDGSSSAPGAATVTMTLLNGLGGAQDWLAVAPVGSSNTTYSTWVYVGTGVTTRTWKPAMPTTPGSYEFRLFANDGFTRLATSLPIAVGTISPAPSVTSVTPLSTPFEYAPLTLTVDGFNFVANSVVKLANETVPTTFVSSTQLTAIMPANMRANVGLYAVRVTTPAPGGGTSNQAVATYITGQPQVLSVAPAWVYEESPNIQVVVTGNNFQTNGTIEIGGASVSASGSSSTTVVGTVPAAALTSPGFVPFTVTFSGQGNGASNQYYLRVLPATGPSITSISPKQLGFGSGQRTITVTGSNFSSGSTVFLNAEARPTTLVSPTQLTAILPSSDFTSYGNRTIWVSTTTWGDPTSNFVEIEVEAPILALSAASSAPGAPGIMMTMTHGVGGGQDWLTVAPTDAPNTTYGEWTYVGAAGLATRTWQPVMPTTPGTYEFRLFANNGYTRLATSPTFTISADGPVPVLSYTLPGIVTAGILGVEMSFHGAHFTSASKVRINGYEIPTTVVSDSVLKARIHDGFFRTAGTRSITVSTPGPGGGTSSALSLTVRPTPDVPLITSVSPTSVVAGSGDLTLTVNGSNFVSYSAVESHGFLRPTTYVSPQQLIVTIPAELVAAPGDLPVYVYTWSPGGGYSNGATVSVTAPGSSR